MEADKLLNYQPNDFLHPDKLTPGILQALDRFAEIVGQKGTILSDWRPYDPENPNSRHNFGDAIDITYPGADPLEVLRLAQDSGLFDGIGIYLNENKATSFHFDKRGHAARWGALITPAVDPDTGQTFRKYEYTTLDRVVDRVKAGLSSVVQAVAEVGGQIVEATGEAAGGAIQYVKKKPTTTAVVLLLVVAGVLLSRN